MTDRRDQHAEDTIAQAARELAELDADPAAQPPVRARRQQDVTQVYSVRIPVDQIARLRDLADARAETPSGLMRRWVLERLELEISGRSAERTPSDLEQLVEHALERGLARRGLLPDDKPATTAAAAEPEYLDPSGPVRLGARRLRPAAHDHRQEQAQ